MEVDAEVMQTYPCFHCIEKDKRIAALEAELTQERKDLHEAWDLYQAAKAKLDAVEKFNDEYCKRNRVFAAEWKERRSE